MLSNRRIVVEYASIGLARELVATANPCDPKDATKRLARAVASIVRAPVGTIGAVMLMCSDGVALVLRYEVIPFALSWKSSAKFAVRILKYITAQDHRAAHRMYNQLSLLPQIIRREKSKRPLQYRASVPVLTQKALYTIQGWCSVFESKFVTCNGSMSLRFRLIDKIIEYAMRVAADEMNQEQALRYLLKFNRRLAAA